MIMRRKDNFMDNLDMVNDMIFLGQNQFLIKYKNITINEYNNTRNRIIALISSRVELNKEQKKKRDENIQEARKKQLEYYYKNREKINTRRNYLNSIKSKENKKYKKTKANEKQIIKEYIELHKEEIELMKKQRQIEKKIVYDTLYYFSKTKPKREEKRNGND